MRRFIVYVDGHYRCVIRAFDYSDAVDACRPFKDEGKIRLAWMVKGQIRREIVHPSEF